MLARYKIYRGKRPADDPLPEGTRKDTRKHTCHCLRPTEEIVTAFLSDPTPAAWEEFVTAYTKLIEQRHSDDPTAFDQLAQAATDGNVYLGCSCPTQNNPDVNHCHTVLALRFMGDRYPHLDVHFP